MGDPVPATVTSKSFRTINIPWQRLRYFVFSRLSPGMPRGTKPMSAILLQSRSIGVFVAVVFWWIVKDSAEHNTRSFAVLTHNLDKVTHVSCRVALRKLRKP